MDDSLEKLGYNGKQGDGSIVRDIMDIAFLKNWNNVCFLPFMRNFAL
jgi:hypothetical protein